jgi:MarR family transcriptional regulator, organic hydroperoxide resistance regulator
MPIEGKNKSARERWVRQEAEEFDPVLGPLGLAFRAMMGAFEHDTGVGASKSYFLRLIAREDGLSQGEVCRRFGVDPSRVTRVVQSLEGEGLVSRERSPDDNRVVLLHLTEKGRNFVEGFPESHKGFERRVAEALSDEEIKQLRRLLNKLVDAMQY